MSYTTEHKRIKPVLDLARKLDIATNPAPEALFEAGSGGFQIWATPDDHPQGWDGVPMSMGTFAKPCAFVAQGYFKKNDVAASDVRNRTSAKQPPEW